jgi:hypothetical protein
MVRESTARPNKGMKQTSVEHIGRSQLIPGVRWSSWRCTKRTRPAAAAPGHLLLAGADRIGLHSIKPVAACEQNQQLIGKNPQLMRISDNSGLQSAVSGVVEADVASLFSEARSWSPFRLGGEGVQAAAQNASLSSEATASLLRAARRRGRPNKAGAASWCAQLMWRYHHRESESGRSRAWAG